jgi:hypothetical protein
MGKWYRMAIPDVDNYETELLPIALLDDFTEHGVLFNPPSEARMRYVFSPPPINNCWVVAAAEFT